MDEVIPPRTRVGGDGAVPAVDCLAGGGNMGALMRAFDWSKTPLGPVDVWPQSLRTAVSIMLASGFPMVVLWGEEYIQLYNDAYRPVLGATKHPAALGQRARECWPEIWESALGPMFGSVMAGGEPIWSEDLRFVLDRNGYLEETYFTFSYSAIRDETGRPGGILVTCVETTDRVIGERRLRTLRELAAHSSRSQTIEETCVTAAKVLSSNPNDLPFALVYLTREDRAELCATSAIDWNTAASPNPVRLGDGCGAALVWPLAQVLATGTPELVTDFGSDIGPLPGGPWPEPASAALVLPITHAGQEPAGALVAGISPRRALDGGYRAFLELVAAQISTAVAAAKAYEAERQRAEALTEIDRAKTAFFNNVSHEFRTPLTLLLGPLEAALASSQVLTGPDLVSVHRNAVRLLKLVNTLLDFSRIEAGRVQASYEKTDIAAVTTDLASMFRPLTERAGLRLDVQCEPIESPVYVDREMWDKIVLNLLSNAFKFTFDGVIRVGLRQQGNAVELTVSDTGAGIPEEELPHVFERFHRARGARARSHEGTGIGLALVAELVRLHHGSIAVHSRVGEGTSFTVRVPTGRAHLPADRVGVERTTAPAAIDATAFLQESEQWQAESLPPEQASVGRGVHILVADDNADLRRYLTSLLSARWSVEAVPDGEAALAAIVRRKPDLLIADVMMPGLDGFELLKRIRADRAMARLPVILLSARAREEARVEGLTAGADDYLAKPFSARELIARVGTQVELSRLRSEAVNEYERLYQLLQLAPAGIALLRGPDHVFELANEHYLKLIGNRHIIGLPGREAIPEVSAQGLWDLMDQVYASGEVHSGRELHLRIDRRGDGNLESAYFDFVCQPVRGVRGEVESIFAHVVDVTEQVVARQEVEKARQAAEAASRAKDEFLAMLGHELRNPLAPILTALQLMNLRGTDEAARERGVIDRQVRHLVRLVDDLLDVSRIARGKVELRKGPVELGDVVSRAIEMASPLLEERQQVLSVTVPRTGLLVAADVTRLAQVLMNLLTNAAKYTQPRGRIHVGAARRGAEVELSIVDSGAGIPPDLLPHVFDLFVQGSQAPDRSRGGLGLGLTIVRSLVQLHGGSVEARSAGVGQGSEFIVRLPILEAVPSAALPSDTAGAAGRVERPLRILVVDDNYDAAQMISAALEAVGHTTAIALDGPSALETAVEFRPEVALLDLGLPVMDGYELAGQLRVTCTPPPVLLAVTGYGQETDRQRSSAAGFAAHIVKPVDFDILSGFLNRIASEASGVAGE